MDIVEALNWRYATKQFDPNKKLTQDQLFQLKESLRLAPSSFGLQLWKFMVIDDAKMREDLKPFSWNQSQITDCSHLVVLARPKEATAEWIDGYMNDIAKTRNQDVGELEGFKKVINGFVANLSKEQQIAWMDRQIYIALGQLMSTAAFMGVDTCPLEGFQPEKYDEYLKLPEKGLASVVLCALGFRSSEDKYATTPKVRYPSESVFI